MESLLIMCGFVDAVKKSFMRTLKDNYRLLHPAEIVPYWKQFYLKVGTRLDAAV